MPGLRQRDISSIQRVGKCLVDLFICCYKNRDIIQCIQLTVYSGLKNRLTGKPQCKLWLTGEIAHQFRPLSSAGIGNRLLTALARCHHGVKGAESVG